MAELGPIRCPRMARPDLSQETRFHRCADRILKSARNRVQIRVGNLRVDARTGESNQDKAMTESTFDLTDAPRGYRGWAIFAVWTAGVVIYALVLQSQGFVPFPFGFVTAGFYYYTLAVLMLPVARWSKRLHNRRLGTFRVAVRHHAAGVLVILAWQSLNFLYARLAVGPGFWQLIYADTWMFQLFTAVTTYGSALGVMLALQSSDRERERERRESQLLILARDSELAAIKAQMQPHFVLNVLNSILALIDKDPALARTMVTRLSEMMRAVFEQFDVVQVPLRREIELTKAYLDIERIRFGSRLNVIVEIETETGDAIVPAFLLQPIVENAIKHGVNHYTGNSELRIRSRFIEQRLILEVTNSRRPGPLVDLDSSGNSGRGLQLTRRRLAATFGPDHQLMFDPGPSSLTVRLDIPAHTYDDRTIAAAHRG